MRRLFLLRGLPPLAAMIALGTAVLAAEGTAMTRAEISATVIGSTLVGTSAEGGSYAEYYAADGTIRGESAGGRYVGSWWLRDDDTMCFKYGDGPFDAGCVYLSLTGDTVGFMRIDGTSEEPATLVRGNPKNL